MKGNEAEKERRKGKGRNGRKWRRMREKRVERNDAIGVGNKMKEMEGKRREKG